MGPLVLAGMAHTLTVLTLWLAQAIGLYAIALGVLLLMQPGRLAAILDDLERSPAMALLAGVAAFALGVAILIPHHVTYDPLALVVTLLGALALVEGLALIAFPDALLALARRAAAAAQLWGVVALVAGIMLFLAGFTGRADALP